MAAKFGFEAIKYVLTKVLTKKGVKGIATIPGKAYDMRMKQLVDEMALKMKALGYDVNKVTQKEVQGLLDSAEAIAKQKPTPESLIKGKKYTDERGRTWDFGTKDRPFPGFKPRVQQDVDSIIKDLKTMEPTVAMKEANLIIGRKGKYKNLSNDEAQRILKDTDDHIFQRDIQYDEFGDPIKPDPEDMASGGRIGLGAGGLAKGAKWFIASLKKNLTDIEAGHPRFKVVPVKEQKMLTQGYKHFIASLERGNEVPIEALEAISKNPQYYKTKKVVRSRDPDLAEVEELIDAKVFGNVRQELKDFEVVGRKPQAEGGRASLMYGGDPGFAFEYGGSWADWRDKHQHQMPVTDYIKTKLPKERLPFRDMQSGGLAYMLGEPTYMKYEGGGSVGHAPWHKPSGQPQPQGQNETPTPNVATRPDPMKAPRGIPSVAPKNMDPAYMQQQVMQKAMMGQGNTGQGPRTMANEGGRIGLRRGTSGAPGGGDPGMTSDPEGKGQTHSGGGGEWSPGVGGTQHIPTPKPDPKPSRDVWNQYQLTQYGPFGGPFGYRGYTKQAFKDKNFAWENLMKGGKYLPGADLSVNKTSREKYLDVLRRHDPKKFKAYTKNLWDKDYISGFTEEEESLLEPYAREHISQFYHDLYRENPAAFLNRPGKPGVAPVKDPALYVQPREYDWVAEGGRIGYEKGFKVLPKIDITQTGATPAPGIDVDQTDRTFGLSGLLQGDKWYGGGDYQTGNVKVKVQADDNTVFEDTMPKEDLMRLYVGLGQQEGNKVEIGTDTKGNYTLNIKTTFGGPKEMNQGGIMRTAFKKGGDMSRRGFMKLIAGIAALPVIGKYFKAAKLAKPAAAVTETIVKSNAAGMPSWFPLLVKRVLKEGEDVGKAAGAMERQTVHKIKLPESNTPVEVMHDLTSGDVIVDIGMGKHGWSSGFHGQPTRLVLKKGEWIEPTKGKKGIKTKDEFTIEEAEFTGGHPENIKFEDATIEKYGEHGSDFTEVEKYATGKTTKGSKAQKEVWEADWDDSLPDDMEYASGGLAGLLGE